MIVMSLRPCSDADGERLLGAGAGLFGKFFVTSVKTPVQVTQGGAVILPELRPVGLNPRPAPGAWVALSEASDELLCQPSPVVAVERDRTNLCPETGGGRRGDADNFSRLNHAVFGLKGLQDFHPHGSTSAKSASSKTGTSDRDKERDNGTLL